jgi:hypothetical protein
MPSAVEVFRDRLSVQNWQRPALIGDFLNSAPSSKLPSNQRTYRLETPLYFSKRKFMVRPRTPGLILAELLPGQPTKFRSFQSGGEPCHEARKTQHGNAS